MGSGGFRFILIFIVIACSSSSAAIFGVDGRIRITENSPAFNLSQATAIAVLSSNVSTTSPGKIKLETDHMDEFLCHDEKFASDPSLSYACTGFLVAPDILITAGHCMVNTGESRNEAGSYCEVFSWLFDFNSNDDGNGLTEGLSSEKLYGCKEIIYAIREEVAPYRDFAIVKLNREVKDRAPLKISLDAVSLSDRVTMIGYPLGTPAKLSQGARILLNTPAEQSFITNLDAFEGNSGSPVFNAKNEVIGILTGGTPVESFTKDAGLNCQRYNICNDDGTNCKSPDLDIKLIPDFQMTGSIVQRIAPVLPFIDAENGPFIGM
ncbi:MAG: trypsin-like serine peptidase [Bdellovibrionales bacterium]